MQRLHYSDVRVATVTHSAFPTPFLVGEYIDEYDTFSMSFLRSIPDTEEYEITDIPKCMKPCAALTETLWEALQTGDYPPICIPNGGYYYGEEFHTIKGTENDTHIIAGHKIMEVCVNDDSALDLIFSEYGGCRIVYIGMYAGSTKKSDLWRPIPIPPWMLEDKDAMDIVHAEIEDWDATLLEFTDVYQ